MLPCVRVERNPMRNGEVLSRSWSACTGCYLVWYTVCARSHGSRSGAVATPREKCGGGALASTQFENQTHRESAKPRGKRERDAIGRCFVPNIQTPQTLIGRRKTTVPRPDVAKWPTQMVLHPWQHRSCCWSLERREHPSVATAWIAVD